MTDSDGTAVVGADDFRQLTISDSKYEPSIAASLPASLKRQIDWKNAFWVASGVPALVLFSVGAVAATAGRLSWLVWCISILLGFFQSFTYAEIAGLFPSKSGGASVYGAMAWVPYSKLLAPVSVWCNWFAWSPVLAIGSGLAAGYLLTSFFPANATIHTWQWILMNLDVITPGLCLRVNATFLLGVVILLTVFAIQHKGILQAARLQMILGTVALLPMILIGLVPWITGELPSSHFFPLLPLSHDSLGNPIAGSWNQAGWAVMAGGLFIAAWSTYGFETAVCYTREFKDPKKDTFKAIFYSGLLCLVIFTLVPLTFQGVLGLEGMLSPGIYDGTGVASVMASMIGQGALSHRLMVVMLLFALVLAIMTSMAGSSRTLYQASVDGWLPKYLSRVNKSGAPTAAMWTDLAFNLFLLLMSDYVFVLAISNVGYIIFNFLNLQAGWIHRLDRTGWERPYRCPTWLLALGSILGFANVALMAIGSDLWGKGTLSRGLIFTALILPVFAFRHWVTDRGAFPSEMIPGMSTDEFISSKKAGILPYATLIGAVLLVVCLRHWFH